MKLNKYFIGILSIFLGIFLILVFIFVKDIYTDWSQVSQYIFSGQYENEEYGFSFYNVPEGWQFVETENGSFVDLDILAHFKLEIGQIQPGFELFVLNEETSGISDLVYLGQSKQYFYYYTFLRYPFECSQPTGYEIRGLEENCEKMEDIWDDIEKGIIPSFRTI